MSHDGSSQNDRPSPYAIWRGAPYRYFSASWFLLVFSKHVETVAVGIFVYAVTGDALSLGLIGLVQALPVILLALAGGHIADRFDRRSVLIVMLGLGTAVSCGLLVLAMMHYPVAWIYALLTVGAVAQALGGPSRAAILPQIVAAEDFPVAVTWNSTIFHFASMVGPAAGGLILGPENNSIAAFAVCVVCRIGSLAAIFFVPSRPQRSQSETVTWESLAAGVRFVWATKPILATLTLDLFAVLLGGATYLLPIFCADILGVGPWGVGFLRSAEAVGAVAMAMLLAHLPPMRRAGRTMLWAVTGFGVCTIIFGLSHWFWLSMLMMLAIGALDNVSVVVRHTLVQMLTPDAMRGRVSAVNGVFITASNDLGGMESGLTAWAFGAVASVVMGGIGTILVVCGCAWRWPQILAIGRLNDIRPLSGDEEDLCEDDRLP